jgi:RNA polymerase sigma-70 factor (ECF subfamily)
MAILSRSRPASERVLVERARRGDAEAFATLVRRHDTELRALAFRLLGDRAAMDDALQEAYVRAYRALDGFDGRAAFGTWLYRIAYRTCVDELRRRGRVDWDTLEEEAAAHGARDPMTGVAARLDLAAALDALPFDLRASVLLVDAQGLSYDEAAAVLEVPAGTMASRLNRARAALRAALADGGDAA